MDLTHIRNFCIIAHIDHGKSTLADRLMQTTGAVSDRELTAQHLDSMDLERERGITIKAQAVRLAHMATDGIEYQLNLIDTPGHVDFTYEVSRSLAASDGALLVVDSTQGIQAQTLANIYLAMEYDLPIIPVVNKIDLPAAEPERVASEMASAFGFTDDEFVFVSAKTGEGIVEILEAIVEKIPSPSGTDTAPFRALIFDSKYDSYKGVVAYVRAIDGRLDRADDIRLIATGATAEALEIGFFGPTLTSTKSLETGEVGYVATGLKDVAACRVGDTMTTGVAADTKPLPGYEPMKPMVYTGLYPADGESFPELREALEKLRLNDPALSFEPESSAALGFGFRCGFLGLLHMDVTQERLEREYGLTLIATAPSVGYSVYMTSGDEIEVDNPSAMPSVQEIDKIYEPWVDLNIVAPSRFIGAVMDLVTTRRGEYTRMEYLQSVDSKREEADLSAAADARVLLEYKMPLAELLVDFHSQLKSRSQGYASMDYSIADSRPGDMEKLDVLVNHMPVDALSMMIHRDNAQSQGRDLVTKLKKLIPRQMFEVPIQSAVGSRVIARETVKAMRKNVLAKCYGGDVTRKRKLLEKQAKGKKRMKKIGSVDVPQEAFMAVLSLERD